MQQKPNVLAYESTVPYEGTRIHAAAIYCSDGRVGEQFDDFLQNGLNYRDMTALHFRAAPPVLPTIRKHTSKHRVLSMN